MPETRAAGRIATIVACTALCLMVARPASASATPDPGAPPPVTTPISAFPAVTGPLAKKILQEETDVEALGQQVQALQESVNTDAVWTSQAFARWQATVVVLSEAQSATADAATQAYENLDAFGPLGDYTDEIQQLSLVAPGLINTPIENNGEANTQKAAQAVETNAFNAYLSALSAQQTLQTQLDQQKITYEQRNASLTKLLAENKAALALASAAQDSYDEGVGKGLPIGTSVNGMKANPKAVAAINYALKQLGDPYVFGAEGPNTYDCSGLTWASYRSAGVSIPRVARYQYHATTRISIQQLLPGDLVFFSTTSRTDWTQISHVGMYVGDGKMIEAPHTGDVVKIAPVWWSAFFGATRVVPAVPAPKTPTPTPTPKPTPKPTPTPTPTPSPTQSPSPSPSDSPSPSPSDSPSPSPSDSPSPSPSDSPSPSPSDSPSASPSDSPSASPSTSPSPDPSPGPTPDPSPDPSTSPSVTESARPSASTSTSTG